jgi:hypothetical protein
MTNGDTSVVNQADIAKIYNDFYNDGGVNSYLAPIPWKATQPSNVPDVETPWDYHQDYKKETIDTFGADKVDEVLNELGGKDSNWHIPPKPIDPNQILTDEDKAKIHFYDDINKFFGGNIPSDLKTQWENLSKWPPKFTPDDLETSFNTYSIGKDCKIKHIDYDAIKQNLSDWTNLFPLPLTPQQIKAKYDEPKGGALSKDDQEAINNYKPTKANLDKWEAKFGKDPSVVEKEKHTDYDTIKAERDSWVITFPKLTSKGVDDIIKDYETKVHQLFKLIKNHTEKQ